MYEILSYISNLFAIAGLDKYHIYGAVFIAYIVIKEVFVFMRGETKIILKTVEEIKLYLLDFKQAESPINEMNATVKQFAQMMDELRLHIKQTDELYKWHDKEDTDGVKIWYVRSSLEKTFEKLSETLESQEKLMSAMMDKIESMCIDTTKTKVVKK